MDIIGKRKIYLSVAVILVLASWLLILILGFRPGIDLIGGTEWRLSFEKPVSQETLVKTLTEAAAVKFTIRESPPDLVLRFPPLSEEEHQKYAQILQTAFGNFTEKSFASIGPTISAELRRKAFWAIGLVLFGISVYIAWSFRKVSRHISSFKCGLVILLCLFHDVSIPAGLLALLGRWQGVEIDTNFIVALLVIMGFSVHDTIVVFDRIRENLLVRQHQTGRLTLKEVINYSVKETIVRSINTSLTFIIVLVSLLLVGPPVLFYFILTILVGTVVGTYSSIFVASPALYVWRDRRIFKD